MASSHGIKGTVWPWTIAAWILYAGTLYSHPGSGLVVTEDGTLYFTHGNAIVSVELEGPARIVASDESKKKFYQLHHLAQDAEGNIYTASDSGTGIWRIDEDGAMAPYYPPPNQSRPFLVGLGGDPFALDAEGNVYAINSVQYRTSQIVCVAPSGQLSVLAGGEWGHRDGRGQEAQFGNLHSGSMAMDGQGNLLLTDSGQYLRRIAPDGTVTTLAGDVPTGKESDVPDPEISFHFLQGIALASDGSVYVADAGREFHQGRIFRIDPGEGEIQLVAGGGDSKAHLGDALAVSLNKPSGLALGADGSLFILQAISPRIRKLTPAGKVMTVPLALPR